MKKSIHATAFTLALAAFAFAPASARADGLILRGGMNFANADTDPEIDADNQESRPGLNLALLTEAGTGPARLLVGVGYENRGARANSVLGDAEVRVDYVTVPVMLSLGTVSSMDGGWMPRLFVNLGAEPALLISDKGSFEDFDFDIEPERFDFALRGEAGIEVPISEAAGLVIGAGYSRSLTDAAKDDDLKWYNTTVSLFGGVKVGMF